MQLFNIFLEFLITATVTSNQVPHPTRQTCRIRSQLCARAQRPTVLYGPARPRVCFRSPSPALRSHAGPASVTAFARVLNLVGCLLVFNSFLHQKWGVVALWLNAQETVSLRGPKPGSPME